MTVIPSLLLSQVLRSGLPTELRSHVSLFILFLRPLAIFVPPAYKLLICAVGATGGLRVLDDYALLLAPLYGISSPFGPISIYPFLL